MDAVEKMRKQSELASQESHLQGGKGMVKRAWRSLAYMILANAEILWTGDPATRQQVGKDLAEVVSSNLTEVLKAQAEVEQAALAFEVACGEFKKEWGPDGEGQPL